MTAPRQGSDRELVLTRLIDAPREKLYRAWTEPELLKQWFTPAPYTTPHAELDVRPGTQSGTEQVLRGHGIPSLRGQQRGNLVATIVVETPTRVDERQRELLRELAKMREEEAPDGRVQPAQKSVFGRFKDAFK